MKLTRAHGLGNVYLVLDEGPSITPELARALCDTATGLASDGVLEPVPSERAEHGVRIWNPDGSVAEKSGNGLRIFARWLFERGAGEDFTVDTGTDVVRCELLGDLVRIEMGRATLQPAAVPVSADEPVIHVVLEPPAPQRPVIAVGVGNPHCVVFVDEPLDSLPWRAWGEALETHPRFPNRTNVQVARVVDGALHLRIWERGAGVTPASGSSACAVAAAAVATGRVQPGPQRLIAPGGELSVEVSPELDLRLTGPVEIVGTIALSEAWLARVGLR